MFSKENQDLIVAAYDEYAITEVLKVLKNIEENEGVKVANLETINKYKNTALKTSLQQNTDGLQDQFRYWHCTPTDKHPKGEIVARLDNTENTIKFKERGWKHSTTVHDTRKLKMSEKKSLVYI